MRTPRSRRLALVQAGFTKDHFGEQRLDVDAVARRAKVCRASVYAWIRGHGGRFTAVAIESQIKDRLARKAS